MILPAKILTEKIITQVRSKTDYTIYDYHPSNVAYPYISMGRVRAIPWTDKDNFGQNILATLDIWAEYHGRKVVEEIGNTLTSILIPFYPDLGPQVRIEKETFDGWDIIKDINGTTWHGILTIRYLINEI